MFLGGWAFRKLCKHIEWSVELNLLDFVPRHLKSYCHVKLADEACFRSNNLMLCFVSSISHGDLLSASWCHVAAEHYRRCNLRACSRQIQLPGPRMTVERLEVLHQESRREL